MSENYGKLYLIPTPLGDTDPSNAVTPAVLDIVCSLDCFVVEELRSARRYLSRAGLKGRIEGLELVELNEHTDPSSVASFAGLFREGRNVGLISEAGLPAVADPGALLVDLAHRKGIEVVPFIGPSSLMMALMSSGMNGQCFAFCGYLPVKPEERRARLKAIEKLSSWQTQIFIETPYRNDSMLADIVKTCSPSLRLCIAANLTMPDAFVRTKTLAEWTKEISGGFAIGKRPCVFVMSAQ